MNAIAAWLRRSSLPATWAAAGAAAIGVIGAIVGLIIGLRAYAPTAPFAVIEVGLPAAIVGGLVGLVTGTIVRAKRRSKETTSTRVRANVDPD
jgi:ABC-type uncharacterized transport system permease subunit